MSDGRIAFVPLIGADGRAMAVALAHAMEGFEIAGRGIGPNQPAFIIAEIGVNHNGSVELAVRPIDHAVDAGADCVKFQMRDLASLYRNQSKSDDASVPI